MPPTGPRKGEGRRSAVFELALPLEIQSLMVKLRNSYPFFAEMNEKEIRRFLRRCRRESFPRGTEVFREGEYGDAFYLIISGEVSIRLGENEVACLAPGECFGEMGALEGAPRTATAAARENTVALAITQEVLEGEGREVGYKVATMLLKQLGDKLRRADRLLRAGGLGPAPAKGGGEDPGGKGVPPPAG